MTAMAFSKKPRFSRVFRPQGWEGLAEMSKNPLGLRLYCFLAANCDRHNALVVSASFLAEALECTERSIRRSARFLQDNGHVFIVRIGSVNCYVLNPEEIMHDLDKFQDYISVSAQALAKKDKNLRRRLTVLIEKRKSIERKEEK